MPVIGQKYQLLSNARVTQIKDIAFKVETWQMGKSISFFQNFPLNFLLGSWQLLFLELNWQKWEVAMGSLLTAH